MAGTGIGLLNNGCPKRPTNSARAAPGLMAAPVFVGTVLQSTIEHEQQNSGSKMRLSNQTRMQWPNDPSSATAATRRVDRNLDGPPPFAAAHG